MNKDEIIEGNVVIATYMDQHAWGDNYEVEKHEYSDPSSFFENATDCIYHKSNLLYHYHWYWLEDVIFKIQETDNTFEVDYKDNIIKAFKNVVSWIVNKK